MWKIKENVLQRKKERDIFAVTMVFGRGEKRNVFGQTNWFFFQFGQIQIVAVEWHVPVGWCWLLPAWFVPSECPGAAGCSASPVLAACPVPP